MASIQSKVSKSGKRTFYVVVPFAGKRKWLKAGTRPDAARLKRQIEAMEQSQRIEELGLVAQSARIDDFL